MGYESAELAKIAINVCLVASISAANVLAELCERVGADWAEIVPALRLDRRIGTHAFATGEPHDDEGIWLGDGWRALARFDCSDTPRPGAAGALAALRDSGLAIEVLSGDSPARVAALASALGVDAWRARCVPAAKLERVRELRAEGRRVVMVGDGVNDAAVLAGADVAIALADGAALAQASLNARPS